MKERVIVGLSGVERGQVDMMNHINNYEDMSISGNTFANISINAMLAHLIECSDKEEVQACLDGLEVQKVS